MAVQFIFGTSGTGKTSFCVKAIAKALLEPGAEEPLIFLVPEQATYQAERAILSERQIAGYNRLSVLSFARLQFLLSRKHGAGAALSRLGQQMVVQRVLQENAAELKLLGQPGQGGLVNKITETIAELARYAKTPEDLGELAESLASSEATKLSAAKFAELGFIYKEYLRFIDDRFANPQMQAEQMRKAVAEAEFIRGAKLWVDGFAGFTGSELELLAELLKNVSQATIALCMDSSGETSGNPLEPTGPRATLFYPTQRTYAELTEVIKKCKLAVSEPVVLREPVRFKKSPALGHIERNIFKNQPEQIAQDESVMVVAAPNARAEVEFIAKKIAELVRQKNYRWRDIAVVASDIGGYEHYIEALFGDYGIPFFIDRPRPISQHPLVELICSAVRVVTLGWQNSDVFGYLKSGLAGLGRYEVDMLENYCVAFGVSGADWRAKKRWNFAGSDKSDFDEQRIDEIRRAAVAELAGLEAELAAGNATCTASDFVRAVWDFVDRTGAKEKMLEWISMSFARYLTAFRGPRSSGFPYWKARLGR